MTPLNSQSEQGQALLAIIIAMILALSIGVGASGSLITTLRSSSRTYLTYRAQAVTEAAVERILLKSLDELIDYINFDSCGSNCVLQMTNADGVVESAAITLSHLGVSSDPFPVELSLTDTKEVSLAGYSDDTNVHVCWEDPASVYPAVVGQIIKGTKGDYTADSFAYNSVNSSYSSNGFSQATAGNGFSNCLTVSSGQDPMLLRLRALYQDVAVSIVPASSEQLPSQGVLIETTGSALDATYSISVIKTASSLPVPFDFAVFSKSETEALSN